jgi:branched-chain amino acid transport system permease protein
LTYLIALLASGIAYGAVLAIVALGFVLLYRSTGIVNFAHGAFVTLGTYVAVWAIKTVGMPTALGYVTAIALMFCVGVIIERTAFAPLRGRSPLVVVIATLAASIVIKGFISVWQGSKPKHLPSPVSGRVLTVAGAQIAVQRLVIIGVAAVLVAVMVLLFTRTSIGRQVRALAADAETAQLYGVRVRTVSILAFGTSAAMAALAVVLVAPVTAVDLNFGFGLLVSAFAAAVLGGFGSIGGVTVGALVIGLIQKLLGGYILTEYSAALPFIVMLIVIAIRPQGLIMLKRGRL